MEGKNIPVKFPDDDTPHADGSQPQTDISQHELADLPNRLVGKAQELSVTDKTGTDQPPQQTKNEAESQTLRSPLPVSRDPVGGPGNSRINGSAENLMENPAEDFTHNERAGAGPKAKEEPDEEISLILAQGQALEEAQSQIEILTAERSNLYDQILRRQAEFENFRKRSERDKTEFFQRLRSEVLLDLLPVLDNFERALISVEGSAPDAKALQTGVELIHKQLKDALTKMGLQPVEALGATFDPNLHEAITVEATDQHKENTIMEEFERGYKLGDRLLRPAKVKVAALPPR
jgi:molecular chaperone GrpE